MKNTNYPRRMDFEVLRWPTSASLRSFAYYFTAYWLDSVLLPLQSSEIKWHKMIIRLPNTEQYFQIPLVGKYGHYNGGGQTPLFEKGKQFEVSLIPSHSSKSTKTFRLRGVADAYEMFDRPGVKGSLLEKIHLL